MKKLLLIGSYFFVSLNCTAQSKLPINCIFPKNMLQTEGLKGQVSSMRSESFETITVNGKIEKGNRKSILPEDNSFRKFNKNGMYTDFFYYNDSTLKIEKREVVTFDKIGCPSGIRVYDNGRLSWEQKLQYDYLNSELTSFRFDNKGKAVGKQKTKFNNYGEIELIDFAKSGKIKSREVYEYNNNGDITITLNYNDNNQLIRSDTIRYDYNINSVTRAVAGWETTEVRNEAGCVIERHSTSKNLSFQTTFTYEYDKRGNWIKRIEFTNNNPSLIIERKIIYY